MIMHALVLLWYGARNSVNFKSINTKEGKKKTLQSFEGKICKNVCFVQKKLAFVEPV